MLSFNGELTWENSGRKAEAPVRRCGCVRRFKNSATTRWKSCSPRCASRFLFIEEIVSAHQLTTWHCCTRFNSQFLQLPAATSGFRPSPFLLFRLLNSHLLFWSYVYLFSLLFIAELWSFGYFHSLNLLTHLEMI